MTDEKLDMLLRQALQADETPPEFRPVKRPARPKWPGVLAACACLAVCVGAYFILQPSYDYTAATTESAMMTEDAAVEATEAAAPAMGTATTESATEQVVAESFKTADGVADICGYPTALDAAVNHWMQVNAPGAPHEVIADTEDYCSVRTEPAEEDVLYLVIDKHTMAPVSLAELLARGNFAVTEENANMLYVNQNQELVLVQGTEEICLGPIE